MDAVTSAHLGRAREHLRCARWELACVEYAAADASEPLVVGDLEAYAEAAQVSARGDEAVALLRRLFDHRVAAAEPEVAAEVAFWLWWVLLNTNQVVHANGWLRQAGRILGPAAADSQWLAMPGAMLEGMTGDRTRADELLAAIVETGRGEAVPWALSMWGHTLIEDGQLQDGLDRLEEALAVLLDRGLSARVTPWVYCAAVGGCLLARDFSRARAWSRSMDRWLDSLDSLRGAYLGNCRIYRSRLMCINGDWSDAIDEVAAVCDDLQGFTGSVCGHAYYQLGEVERLRGECGAAEDAYRRAAGHGCQTQPGLALLRLAQGDVDAASAGVQRALVEVSARPDRLDLLKAAVAIHLRAGNRAAARDAVNELDRIADELTMPVIEADRCAARGSLSLAEGDPGAALPLLRRAISIWQTQDCPYEVARLNVAIGRACHALGDRDSAQLEFAAARETFERLGAPQELAWLEQLAPADDGQPHGLTLREVEVLGLIARGLGNRAIAHDLHLSERTVHRHVSNLLTKLGVDSRTAAVAFGIRHRIVDVDGP